MDDRAEIDGVEDDMVNHVFRGNVTLKGAYSKRRCLDELSESREGQHNKLSRRKVTPKPVRSIA